RDARGGGIDGAGGPPGRGRPDGGGGIGDPSSSADVHVVFSTDCSGYQHWQSIASYYSLRRAGHVGPITRIASGCDHRQEEALRDEFAKIGGGPSGSGPRVHFTPSFALKGKHYKYSNKPGGFLDWINRTAVDEPVVALVDPDMLALRPVSPRLGEGTNSSAVSRDLFEHRDERGRALLLRQKRLPPLPPRVTVGSAAGQHFGVGGLWASAGTRNARKDFREFNLTSVCGPGSPCLNVPPLMADRDFAAGPVYLAATADWRALLPRWHAFTPRVHAQYPKLLAEMYAFTMAAADMRLKFALSSSYMVSDPGTMSTTEAWLWIDDYARGGEDSDSGERVCDGAAPDLLPTETLRRLKRYGYGHYGTDPSIDIGDGALPTFLHHCQNYKLANHTFAKRRIPHDFFRCDGTALKLDVGALLEELASTRRDSSLSDAQRKRRTRTGFMLCHLIPLMNMALSDYKRDVC
ncbi:hypothetical protein ACHAWF_001421, partial [Thalassiosira exigua]